MTNLYVVSILAVVATYILSIRIYPVIIYLSHKKNLMDEPVERSAHQGNTPTMGGVGIFLTFSLSIILLGLFVRLPYEDLTRLLAILGATVILLGLGVKDDLLILSPKKKLIGQILSSVLVVFLADIRIESLYGIFGIEAIPFYLSVGLTILVFIFVINAFNLIDGIDGLAGTIASICCLAFGIYFLLNSNYLMTLVSFVLGGSLIGFLRYNLSESKSKKLFMGDTGSMLVGFLLAFQAICFLEINALPTTTYAVENAPVLVLAIFSYPILDTMRVFVLRIRQKKSPFIADRTHIHHRLLEMGISHKRATVIISVITVLIVQLTFITSNFYVNFQLYFLILMVAAAYILLLRLNPSSLNSEQIIFSPLDNKSFELADIQDNIDEVSPDNNRNHDYLKNPKFGSSLESDVGNMKKAELDEIRTSQMTRILKKKWKEIKKITAF